MQRQVCASQSCVLTKWWSAIRTCENVQLDEPLSSHISTMHYRCTTAYYNKQLAVGWLLPCNHVHTIDKAVTLTVKALTVMAVAGKR